MLKIIVENLEPCLSPWLMAEYEFLHEIFGEEVVITNVEDPKMRSSLEEVGLKVEEVSFTEYLRKQGIGKGEVVILDLDSKQKLTSDDLNSSRAVIIGGIMGDHPPRGRTKELLTARLPGSKVRNLGKEQLTIAGAAYIVKKVKEGFSLEDIDVRVGLTHTFRLGSYELVIELPYAFPYEGGEPVLPKRYLEVVASRSLYYEEFSECVDKLR